MFVDPNMLITNIISKIPTVLSLWTSSEPLDDTYCILLNRCEIRSD